jgi:anti-sigma factor ChrR (cupin superfamily)
MSPASPRHDQHDADMVFLYALQALPSSEVAAVGAHIAGCAECRQEMETLRPVVDALGAWPTDVLRPTAPVWERLAQRIAAETGSEPVVTRRRWTESDWREAAPGISCKLLATDADRNRVSLLVRLAPGTEYPPHRHAGLEELHLLQGELMIGDRKLYPGDYNRAEAGTVDVRVWSETGCTCVLLTSSNDLLL